MNLWEEEKLMIFCRSSLFRGQMAWTTQESRIIVKSNLIIIHTILDWAMSMKRDSNSMDHFCSYLPTLCGHLVMRRTENLMTLLGRDCNYFLILYLLNQWFFPLSDRGMNEWTHFANWMKAKGCLPSKNIIAQRSFLFYNISAYELPEVSQQASQKDLQIRLRTLPLDHQSAPPGTSSSAKRHSENIS